MRKGQNQAMQLFGDKITEAKAELDAIHSKLRNTHIRLRAEMNTGSSNSSKRSGLESQIESFENQAGRLVEKLRSFGVSQAEIRQAKANNTLGVSAAVGLPAIFGGSYGYQELKQD